MKNENLAFQIIVYNKIIEYDLQVIRCFHCAHKQLRRFYVHWETLYVAQIFDYATYTCALKVNTRYTYAIFIFLLIFFFCMGCHDTFEQKQQIKDETPNSTSLNEDNF